jgi:hypothetical protein
MVAHKPRGARLRCRGRLAAAGRRSCLGHASLHGARMLCDNRGVSKRRASGHTQHCRMLGAMQVALPTPAALREGWCPAAPPRNRTRSRPPWRLTRFQRQALGRAAVEALFCWQALTRRAVTDGVLVIDHPSCESDATTLVLVCYATQGRRMAWERKKQVCERTSVHVAFGRSITGIGKLHDHIFLSRNR